MKLTTSKTKHFCESAAPVMQNHISKPEDLMLQNAAPLGKSAPGPPNSSDEHVSCTAPATQKMHLCRSSSNAPQLPSFLDMLQNHHVLRTFDKLHNPLRLPRETTSDLPKVARSWCTFSLRNALRATTACTFSTSQLPKAVRGWCALCILTSKWVQVKIGGPEQASGPHPFHTPVPYLLEGSVPYLCSIPLIHTLLYNIIYYIILSCVYIYIYDIIMYLYIYIHNFMYI